MTDFSRSNGPSTTARQISRISIRLILLFAICGVFWAKSTIMPQVAFATGVINPTGALRRIEHLDGGVVERIMVAEGDEISPGAPLVVMADDEVDAELASLRLRETVLTNSLDRNRAVLTAIGFSADRPASRVRGNLRVSAQLAAYETTRNRLSARVEDARQSASLAAAIQTNLSERSQIEDREALRVRQLTETGLLPQRDLDTQLLRENEVSDRLLQAQARLVSAQSELEDSENALKEFHATTRDTLLADIESSAEELALVQRAVVENRLRRDRLWVTAPVGGVVQAMYLNAENEVVEPGGIVAEVLPTREELVAELRLKPSDIGQISVGDAVDVKFTTFNAKQFGTIAGRVSQISATSTENERQETYFRVRVSLEQQTIGTGVFESRIRAGMEVNASIVTGYTTVFDYLTDPIRRAFDGAFAED